MADRRYEIEIITTARGDGAATAVSDLAAVEQQAGATRTALDSVGSAASTSSAAAQISEVATATRSVGVAADGAKAKWAAAQREFALARGEVDAMNATLRQTPGALDDVLRGFTSIGGAARQLTLIASAFGIGKVIGEQINDAISRIHSLSDAVGVSVAALERARAASIQASSEQTAQVLAALRSLDSYSRDIIAQVDARAASENLTSRSTADEQRSAAALASAREMSAAGSEDERRAIGALAKVRELQIDTAQKAAAAQIALNQATERLAAAIDARERKEREVAAVRVPYQRDVRAYQEAVSELEKRGISRDRVAGAEGVEREILAYRDQPGRSNEEIVGLLRQVEKIYESGFGARSDNLDRLEREMAVAERGIDQMRTERDAAERAMSATMNESTIAQIEVAKSTQNAILRVETAITALREQRAEADSEARAAIVRPDAAAVQGAAFNRMADVDAQIAALERQRIALADAVNSFGADGRAAADAIVQQLDSHRSTIRSAASGVERDAANAAAGVVDAAGAVRDATAGASGRIVGSIDELGHSISAGFGAANDTIGRVIDVQRALQQQIESLRNRVSGLQRDVDDNRTAIVGAR